MKKLISIFYLIAHFSLVAQDSPTPFADNATFLKGTERDALAFAEYVDNTWMANQYNSPLYENTLEKIVNEEFSSDLLKERLEKLSFETPFEVEYNATVERFIRLYLKTRKGDISNLMDKANYYFPLFEEFLDKYDLPLELKYLAVVESALEPNAKSSAGAKGLWQFMYHTGKQFGLNISSYVDERNDPRKSTEAACKYLKSLYDTFHDWDLVLAAYNSGPGNVSKAIRRSGGLQNYWNIRHLLPSETRGYLPAFYATFYLFEYGQEHQIFPNNAEITYFETDTLHVKKKLTFSKIIEEINIDKQLLTKLNPQYRLDIIPFSNDNKYILTLPKSLISKFVNQENSIYGMPENNKREVSKHIKTNHLNSYIVQQGDNLVKISKKFEISLNELKNWNGLQTDYIIEGQRLAVNTNQELPNNNKQNSDVSQNIKARQRESQYLTYNYETYVVQEGESLFLISKKYPDITINQIRTWNNIWGVSFVEPGTELKILTTSK